MLLHIIDKDSRVFVDIIRQYNFVQYVHELIGDGSFQINIPILNSSVEGLKINNFILFDIGEVGIIKTLSDSQEESEELIITGKMSNVILSYRYILKTSRINGGLSYIARKLVSDNFIFPDDVKRKIDLIKLSEDDKYNPNSKSIAYCDTGNTVRESIATMFLPYSFGFELYPVIKDLDEDNGITKNLDSFEFRVIKPNDRTIENSVGNDPVVFAFQLSNLSKFSSEEDASSFCSVAIVAADGKGDDRRILNVGDDSSNGIDRIELYVDARDIQPETENEGEDLTDDEIEALMEQRGLEKMEEHKVFTSVEGSVITSGSSRYVYGEDFYIGDFVTILDDKLGRKLDLQVTSITKSISDGIEYFDIGFGLDSMQTSSSVSRGSSSGSSGYSGEGSGSGTPTTVTVKVDETITIGKDEQAYVENVGDDVNVKLKFGIPRGKDGIQGTPGSNGLSAGFGIPTASIDSNIGTPSVIVSASGPDTDKVFNFQFSNLKGEKGEDGLSAEEAIDALNGFSFGFTEDGKAGYKVGGADTVIPFNSKVEGGASGLELLSLWTIFVSDELDASIKTGSMTSEQRTVVKS